ncbi:hypothetical protein C8T65DRAFT_28516 [Cerioporus squamosus]|nr:hypothetical protein C8T65DRAFT_28516 [Cerioporus squamosus]
MASFVGFGQRPQLSPQSPTWYFPTLSGSERNGEPAKKAERKHVLLRNEQGWSFNVPESALESSPEVAPRILHPPRLNRFPVPTPSSPRLPPSTVPPSPVVPQVTVSPPPGTDALGLSLNAGVTDKTDHWPSSSRASGTLVSDSSYRSPWSPLHEVPYSHPRGATGLPRPPSTSALSQSVAVDLQVLQSWSLLQPAALLLRSPSPARGACFAWLPHSQLA